MFSEDVLMTMHPQADDVRALWIVDSIVSMVEECIVEDMETTPLEKETVERVLEFCYDPDVITRQPMLVLVKKWLLAPRHAIIRLLPLLFESDTRAVNAERFIVALLTDCVWENKQLIKLANQVMRRAVVYDSVLVVRALSNLNRPQMWTAYLEAAVANNSWRVLGYWRERGELFCDEQHYKLAAKLGCVMALKAMPSLGSKNPVLLYQMLLSACENGHVTVMNYVLQRIGNQNIRTAAQFNAMCILRAAIQSQERAADGCVERLFTDTRYLEVIFDWTQFINEFGQVADRKRADTIIRCLEPHIKNLSRINCWGSYNGNNVNPKTSEGARLIVRVCQRVFGHADWMHRFSLNRYSLLFTYDDCEEDARQYLQMNSQRLRISETDPYQVVACAIYNRVRDSVNFIQRSLLIQLNAGGDALWKLFVSLPGVMRTLVTQGWGLVVRKIMHRYCVRTLQVHKFSGCLDGAWRRFMSKDSDDMIQLLLEDASISWQSFFIGCADSSRVDFIRHCLELGRRDLLLQAIDGGMPLAHDRRLYRILVSHARPSSVGEVRRLLTGPDGASVRLTFVEPTTVCVEPGRAATAHICNKMLQNPELVRRDTTLLEVACALAPVASVEMLINAGHAMYLENDPSMRAAKLADRLDVIECLQRYGVDESMLMGRGVSVYDLPLRWNRGVDPIVYALKMLIERKAPHDVLREYVLKLAMTERQARVIGGVLNILGDRSTFNYLIMALCHSAETTPTIMHMVGEDAVREYFDICVTPYEHAFRLLPADRHDFSDATMRRAKIFGLTCTSDEDFSAFVDHLAKRSHSIGVLNHMNSVIHVTGNCDKICERVRIIVERTMERCNINQHGNWRVCVQMAKAM